MKNAELSEGETPIMQEDVACNDMLVFEVAYINDMETEHVENGRLNVEPFEEIVEAGKLVREVIENEDMDRNQVEAISIDQYDITMRWYILKLKFRNLTIHSFLTVHLDGARHSMVVPNRSFIRQGGIMPLTYYMMVEDSTDYLVDYMMNHVPNSFTSHTSDQ